MTTTKNASDEMPKSLESLKTYTNKEEELRSDLQQLSRPGAFLRSSTWRTSAIEQLRAKVMSIETISKLHNRSVKTIVKLARVSDIALDDPKS